MKNDMMTINLGCSSNFEIGQEIKIYNRDAEDCILHAVIEEDHGEGHLVARKLEIEEKKMITKKFYVESFEEAEEIFVNYSSPIRVMGINIHIARELFSVEDAHRFFQKAFYMDQIPSNELAEIKEDINDEIDRRNARFNKPVRFPNCRSVINPAALKLLEDMERNMFSDEGSEVVPAAWQIMQQKYLRDDETKSDMIKRATKRPTFPDIDLDEPIQHGGVFRESPISWIEPIMPTLPPGAKLFMPNMSRFEITGTPKMKDECDCGFVDKVSAAHYDWCSKGDK